MRMTDYLHQKASALGIPIDGTFELTPRCNLNCKMCYVHLSEEKMKERGRERTVSQWLALAREARGQGMLYLLLTGGEPFLYPDFFRLYPELKKMGFLLSINTNATLLDPEKIAILKENPPVRMNVSLYGTSKETYGRLCGNQEAYERTVENIKRLQDAGIQLKLNASLTPENREDLEGIYTFAKEQGLMVQVSPYMFPPVRREESYVGRGARFTAEDAAEQFRIVELRRIGEIALQEKINRACQNRNRKEQTDEAQPMACHAGKSAFWITWDGKMLPCGMMNYPKTEPFREGFSIAWDKLRALSQELRMPPECSGCSKKEICPVCAAAVYAETGGFVKKPEYLCRMTEQMVMAYAMEEGR